MSGSSLNVWMIAGGYLPAPDGRHARVLDGLPQIGWDMVHAGITVRWGTPPRDKAACSYWWRNEIVLAPWLYDCDADDIRYCITHELAHCMIGKRCEEKVRFWQLGRYRDILQTVCAA